MVDLRYGAAKRAVELFEQYSRRVSTCQQAPSILGLKTACSTALRVFCVAGCTNFGVALDNTKEDIEAVFGELQQLAQYQSLLHV